LDGTDSITSWLIKKNDRTIYTHKKVYNVNDIVLATIEDYVMKKFDTIDNINIYVDTYILSASHVILENENARSLYNNYKTYDILPDSPKAERLLRLYILALIIENQSQNTNDIKQIDYYKFEEILSKYKHQREQKSEKSYNLEEIDVLYLENLLNNPNIGVLVDNQTKKYIWTILINQEAQKLFESYLYKNEVPVSENDRKKLLVYWLAHNIHSIQILFMWTKVDSNFFLDTAINAVESYKRLKDIIQNKGTDQNYYQWMKTTKWVT